MKYWYVNKATQTFYVVEEVTSGQIKATSCSLEVINRQPKRNKMYITEVIDVIVDKQFLLQDCHRLSKMNVLKKVRRLLS